LRVVVLNEAHGALAQITGPWMYAVRRTVLHQTAYLLNSASFEPFPFPASEFVDAISRRAKIGGKYRIWLLPKGLLWPLLRNSLQAKTPGLAKAAQQLQCWMRRVAQIQFWRPDAGRKIAPRLSNRQATNFSANSAKHSTLRLSNHSSKAGKHCTSEGRNFMPQESIEVIRAKNDVLRGRSKCHAALPLVLMGGVSCTGYAN